MNGPFRHERKFQASFSEPEAVKAVLLRHPCCFFEQYPERVVNNVYFDTPALDHYHDHVQGLGQRRKVRIRWYGEGPNTPGKPVLELKIKEGEIGEKRSYALTCPTDLRVLTGASLDSALAGAVIPGALQCAASGLLPVLINRYRRAYFASGCGKFRMTIDSAMHFETVHGGEGPGRLGIPADTIVVELKYSPEDAFGAAQIAQGLPWRAVRFSKYIAGMQTGGGG